MSDSRPQFVLICHEGAQLDLQALPAWIDQFGQLAGLVIVKESRKAFFKRIRFEYRRSGFLGLLDVFAYRAYHRLFMRSLESQWEKITLRSLLSKYPSDHIQPRTILCTSPNAKEVRKFIEDCAPHFLIARCKFILKERVYSIPSHGTFVMHPGICPEYRNAHGCFWALVNEDYERVGMTLLQVDKGIDTGPVFGYFSYPFDVRNETPNIIQQRVLFENLELIRERFREIFEKGVEPIDIHGRVSEVWGQPKLSSYLWWRIRGKSTPQRRIKEKSNYEDSLTSLS